MKFRRPSAIAAALFTALAIGVTAPAQDQARVTLGAARFHPATVPAGGEAVLEVVIDVQEGWHIYGAGDPNPATLQFEAAKGVATKGKPVVPFGKAHEAFGVRNYWLEGRQTLRQRYTVAADAAQGVVKLKGRLDYMACVPEYCEPPANLEFTAELTVTAPEGGGVVTQEPGAQEPPKPVPDTVPGLPGLPGMGDEDKKLSVSARFEPNPARPGEQVRLMLDVTVVPEWHVYGSAEQSSIPTRVKLTETHGLTEVAPAVVPPGERHEAFGVESFHLEGSFAITQVLQVPKDAAPGEVKVGGELAYLPCHANACLDPQNDPFTAMLRLEAGEVRPLAGGTGPANGAAEPPAGGGGDLLRGSLLALILASIGGGLFALVMPCTYPMIPITFSFFTKQADKRGGKVLSLSLTYGLGIVLMFVLVGVVVGEPIGRFAAHPVTNVVIGAAFVVFALSLFGLFTLEPPAFLQNLAGKAGSAGGGGLLGVFLMGATLVITSFTCTAPIVGGLIAGVAQGGNTGRVALGMAVFGLTMAAPFVLLSLLPRRVKALPKSGEWMNTLKVTLGFIELAAALKFFSNAEYALGWHILPRQWFFAIWAAVFVALALYLLGAFRRGVLGLGRGRRVGALLSQSFALYCVYAALGFPTDFVMTAFAPPYGRLAESAVREHVIVKDDYELALRTAGDQGKLLLVNFTGFA